MFRMWGKNDDKKSPVGGTSVGAYAQPVILPVPPMEESPLESMAIRIQNIKARLDAEFPEEEF